MTKNGLSAIAQSYTGLTDAPNGEAPVAGPPICRLEPVRFASSLKDSDNRCRDAHAPPKIHSRLGVAASSNRAIEIAPRRLEEFLIQWRIEDGRQSNGFS